jgi:hypothetical protein
MTGLNVLRWVLLAVGAAAVIAEIALRQPQREVGRTVLATAMLYWIVTQIHYRRG